MAKFPTYEEMAHNVAEKALDEILYDGKSIRDWIQIITSEDAISREEAIEMVEIAFDAYESEYDTGDDWSKQHKARDMAIKALEQEPTTKNDLGVDCIDRAELLKAMDTWDKFGYTARYGLERLDKDDKGFVPYVKYDDMVNCVKGMSSVTSIRPKGHWISHREHCENLGVMPSGLGAYEWCSNCDCGIDVREWHRNNYNYCPNCGAIMIEPQESEDKE